MKLHFFAVLIFGGVIQAAENDGPKITIPDGQVKLYNRCDDNSTFTISGRKKTKFVRTIETNTGSVIVKLEYQCYSPSQYLIPATVGATVGSAITLAVTQKNCAIL